MIIVAVAVTIVLALLVAGQFPRRHPLLPALRFHARRQALSAVQSHHHLKLRLPRSARLGSHTDFTGEAAAFPGRRVTLLGSREHGPWMPLAQTRVRPDGHFSLSLRYRSRGLLHLRLTYPSGDVAEGSITVR